MCKTAICNIGNFKITCAVGQECQLDIRTKRNWLISKAFIRWSYKAQEDQMNLDPPMKRILIDALANGRVVLKGHVFEIGFDKRMQRIRFVEKAGRRFCKRSGRSFFRFQYLANPAEKLRMGELAFVLILTSSTLASLRAIAYVQSRVTSRNLENFQRDPSEIEFLIAKSEPKKI